MKSTFSISIQIKCNWLPGNPQPSPYIYTSCIVKNICRQHRLQFAAVIFLWMSMELNKISHFNTNWSDGYFKVNQHMAKSGHNSDLVPVGTGWKLPIRGELGDGKILHWFSDFSRDISFDFLDLGVNQLSHLSHLSRSPLAEVCVVVVNAAAAHPNRWLLMSTPD